MRFVVLKGEIQMYKLVVSDMDGTLLMNHTEISEYNKKAIKEITKKGVIFVLATGRLYGSARIYAKQLELNTPIIACNGGIIRNSLDKKILFDAPIERPSCVQVFDLLKSTDTYFHFYGADTFYTEKVRNKSFRFSQWNATLPEEDKIDIQEIDDVYEVFEKDNVYKILIHLNKNLRKNYYIDELNKISNITITSSWHDNLEICGKNVNKGNAVRRFSQQLNILPHEIICIGDNLNDLSMIEYAGLGIAMDNAEEEVKKAADYIAPANDADGVGKVLEKFILSV